MSELTAEQLAAVRELLRQPNGLVLFAGPHAEGNTTGSASNRLSTA